MAFSLPFEKLLVDSEVQEEDFTESWLYNIMENYIYQKYNGSLSSLVKVSQQRLSYRLQDEKRTSERKIEDSNFALHRSQLSRSYRISVRVEVENSPTCPRETKARLHHLFLKLPLEQNNEYERIVRRNRTLTHEIKVYSGFLQDLKSFILERVGKRVALFFPELIHGQEELSEILVIDDIQSKGYASLDWFTQNLTHSQILLAVTELSNFHACGLAYKMSLSTDIEYKYPYLDDDLYTSNMAKELLAKYLDSYFHFLSFLPGIKEHVFKLRKISGDIFQLLVKLRRPSDILGKRFNTICHGDMWMGNLMYKGDSCVMVDFHSCQYLSPATDLAHLLLTSTDRDYRLRHWNDVIEHYYVSFNKTLSEFGLLLRHLGTTYEDFLTEVKRALRGQFLCVAFIIPIVIYCGPGEWRSEKRRGSSVDRKNTVRHLIQMMAINEETNTREPFCSQNNHQIPVEFEELYKDEDLKKTLVELFETAADLDILDFEEFCNYIDKPKPNWKKTQNTTGKHIPVY